MAKFFIDRPIFAWVIAIFVILAGVIGIRSLPVSQYPSVGAPTITLTAAYPGASAQVMEDSVLAVIERNMNGIEGLDYMSTSASANGVGEVSLTFTPETDEDLAQVNVQNKLSEVTALLPATVQQNGITVSKSRSNFLMVLMFDSKVMETEDIADPPVVWCGMETAIQKTGIARDLGIFDDPDSFYQVHGENLSGFRGLLYKHVIRHRMNRRVRAQDSMGFWLHRRTRFR